MSKIIRVLLWFCFTSLCDWLKPFTPLSRPIRSKTQTNQSRLARACTRFPALDAGYMYVLRVLIGSFDNLCLLSLARVITLVLVLRHSFEKRSKHESKPKRNPHYSEYSMVMISNNNTTPPPPPKKKQQRYIEFTYI